ncbi:MAG: phosphoribosylformylglycinamidine synthase subunit PurS [archaeon]|nr:phosphoribosylformylglycinamidine synthase subunit PurS [archaeon]
MVTVEIRIELKKGIVDPEGKNVMKTLKLLGFSGVRSVKSIKVFDVELDASPEEAIKSGEEMCTKLLANSVIQDFKVTVR